MNATLKAELAKLTPKQKLKLADQLIVEASAHEKPPGVMSADDPGLEAELRRRLKDTKPGDWLTLEEFQAKLNRR